MADTYDILIIGAGPGGYVAAIRAAQLGFKTAVVDREHLGGICLNWGCIPTKALLRSAEIYHYMQHASDYGLSAEKVGFDTAAIVKRSRGVSTRLNGGVGMLLKKNKVDVIWGEATITAAAKGNQPGEVTVKETARAPAPRGPVRSRASSPTRSRSGPTTRPWCRRRCPRASSSWARAPSGSSSPRSTAPWAPRSR
jgi:dihydrolipoamide dehydrogenase